MIESSTYAALLPWLPIILKGFGFDVLISVLAMLIGTAGGLFLGLAQISKVSAIKIPSRLITQFFRNAPWLVILFFCIYLLPFELKILGIVIPFPAWIKGVIGLSLPVMGNVSEVVRGGVQSIDTGQWEAASAMGLSRRQTLRLCILPQARRRMIAPWMNTYAVLMMSTPLVSIVGVDDSLRVATSVLSTLNEPALLMPMYGFLLLLFFLYCAPIAMWTRRLEVKA